MSGFARHLRHNLSERGNDLYETPEVATRALLAIEPLPHRIWEPACGPGAIVRVLRAHGHQVEATDLVDYQSPDQDQSGVDFLLQWGVPPFEYDAIVTNPPFKNADDFVRQALRFAPKVVMLLRLAFLESERRNGILDGGKLARVHLFRKRLPGMNRDGWAGNKANSGMAFAWFVWERDHSGPIVIDRL